MNDTRIRDLLNVSPRFFRSAELERDFMDPESLDGYIVTPEVTRNIQRLARGFARSSGQRAWRITGDFGSGKSSFALVLANLLGRPAGELPKSVRGLRDELGLVRNSPKFLPILVTGSREVLSVALLRSLFQALNASIDGRRKLRCKTDLAELLSQGEVSDRDAITAIQRATTEIVEQGFFGGVLLIIDELGKFLEFAALHPERQDVYFLQQLGEAAARSGKAPLYTIGLLHQGFAAYADKLSDSGQREWEKVAGRFEELVFSQPLSQVATLLSAALCVKETPSLRGWKSRSRQDMASAIELGLYGPAPGKTSLVEIAPDLYPIHATVLPVLTHFFRRFGQNERSLFSFLLSSEPFALQDFATQRPAPETVYNLANFYDFAAHNFAHRLSTQSFRSHWNHIDSVIRSAAGEAPADLEILKVVGILNVIESPELAPTEETLSLALGHPKDLRERLNYLCKQNSLFFRGRGGYALWPHTSVNLEQAFIKATETITNTPPIADVVRTHLEARPIVARRHYIQTGNLRHFAVRFLTANELAREGANLLPEAPADGVLAVILCENVTDRQNAQKFAADFKDTPQVLFAISSPLESLSGFALELERWHWVERHTLELKDDRFAAEEVSRQIATVSHLLENRIHQYLGFGAAGPVGLATGISWYHLGRPASDLNDGISLQSFLSKLCDEVFSDAPKIRNELVNRHAISSAAAAARQKLFKLMIEAADQELLGIPRDKAPPEKSMYLSVLRESRLHRQDGERWQLKFPEPGRDSDPCQVRPVLNAVVRLLEERPDARINVGEIRNRLRQPPFGIRDGVIPLLLLATLVELETEIAVFEDGVFQPTTDEFLMQRLVKSPHTFEFQLCRITGVRRDLITKLAAVVEADRAEKGQLLSIVRPLCLFVAELPEYVKNTDSLTPETLALRNVILNAREPTGLIFTGIPKALGFKVDSKKDFDSSKLASQLAISLTELRRAFPELQARMAHYILNAFDSAEGSLEEWRPKISAEAEPVIIGVNDADLRAFILKLIDDLTPESDWLESFGSFLTRCPPSRWKDQDEKVFVERVSVLACQFQRVQAISFIQKGTNPDSAVRIALTQRSGDERNYVVQLKETQSKPAEELRQKLSKVLSKDKQVSLAALSKLIWNLLDEGKHDPN